MLYKVLTATSCLSKKKKLQAAVLPPLNTKTFPLIYKCNDS